MAMVNTNIQIPDTGILILAYSYRHTHTGYRSKIAKPKVSYIAKMIKNNDT